MPAPSQVSQIKVLKSAAGFYIGRTYTKLPMGEVPYDRQSRYFETADAAAKFATERWAERRLDDQVEEILDGEGEPVSFA